MKASVRMHAVGTLLTVLLVVPGFPRAASAQDAEGSFERTLNVSGQIDLEVVSGSGRIEVRPGGDGQVSVTGRIRANDGRSGRSSLSPDERVRRIEANPPISQTGSRVVVGRIEDDDLERGVSISYTVTVPRDATVVATTGSGAHDIQGIAGRIEARSGSGSIRIRDAGGDVRATTGSGSIDADSVAGAFEARSGSGSIAGRAIGGAIMARSGSGSIDMDQSGQGDVDVSTASGSLSLRGIRGGLRASTASGALRVEGEQTSPWRLTSASGSILIDLAGAPAFDLDAHSNSGRISTNFPVTVANVGRRELRGSVNGGGPLLHVRSASGGITIR